MVLASRMRPYRILGVANRVLELPTFIDDVVRGQPPLLKVKLRQRSIHFVGGVSTDYASMSAFSFNICEPVSVPDDGPGSRASPEGMCPLFQADDGRGKYCMQKQLRTILPRGRSLISWIQLIGVSAPPLGRCLRHHIPRWISMVFQAGYENGLPLVSSKPSVVGHPARGRSCSALEHAPACNHTPGVWYAPKIACVTSRRLVNFHLILSISRRMTSTGISGCTPVQLIEQHE